LKTSISLSKKLKQDHGDDKPEAHSDTYYKLHDDWC
jgi:hypothetical protein